MFFVFFFTDQHPGLQEGNECGNFSEAVQEVGALYSTGLHKAQWSVSPFLINVRKQ